MDSIQEIIDRCSNINENERNLLSQVFDNLKNEQSGLFKRIEDSVISQIRPEKNKYNDKWEIFTVLADDTKENVSNLSKKGFEKELNEEYGILSNQEKITYKELVNYNKEVSLDNITMGNFSTFGLKNAGIVFFDCDYSKIRELIDEKETNYVANVISNNTLYKIKYYFRQFNSFLTEEERLEQLASQYEIGKPYLYSPYSRRAYEVILEFNEDIKESDDFLINFQYEKNGLKDFVLFGKNLFWNVSITYSDDEDIPKLRETKDEIKTSYLPQFDKTYTVYDIPVEGNEFVFIKSENQDLIRDVNPSKVYLGISRNSDTDFYYYEKFKINKIEDLSLKDLSYLHNDFVFQNILKMRVRTKSDLQLILSSFENIELKDFYFSQRTNQLTITVYNHEDSYHYPKDMNLRKSTICYLKLECKDSIEEKFKSDYLSYVFAYLNYFYPEFYWVGVK